MPLVGMRWNTRVFGTVLQSGRRVWRGLVEGGKYIRTINGDNQWIELGDNSREGRGDGSSPGKGSTWDENENENDLPMRMVTESKLETWEVGGAVEATNEDMMYGIVFSRKRKRMESKSTGISEDMRFGKKFMRKKWRKKLESCGELQDYDTRCRELAVIAAESSGDSDHWIAWFLNSALRYLQRDKFGLQGLSVFVSSEPISHAFSLHGIRFLKDPTSFEKPGFCIISESRSSIPVFTVDYSAVPFSFMLLHSSMHLRSIVMHPFVAIWKVEKMTDYDKERSSGIPSGTDQSDCTMVSSEIDDSGWRELSHSTIGLSKLPVQNNQLRTGHGIQKPRTSLGRRRGRPPSVFRAQRGRLDGFQSSITPTGHAVQSSIKGSSTINTKTLNSIIVGSTQEDIDANSCIANVLVVDMDKCYREEGAIITLEVSALKNWFLAVKKDRIERYSLSALKDMRPSSFDRVTHANDAIIWSRDSNWKLEFPCKQDWLIFKELYKKCYNHNVQVPATIVIPVPGVREVVEPPYTDIPYVRPDSYITVKDDELARALEKRTANYDMDCEDEEWLNKFNNEINVEKELHQLVMPERFELIIEALERGFHSNADDWSDEKVADSVGMDLERKEVVEAVRSYWIPKRRRKHSALVRIFQIYKPRRTEVIPKTVLRKKRSFKRHGTQPGRGKQPPFLQATAAEQDALEQQKNFFKVQEAKAEANRYEEFAILKRQRAQTLTENADLATYKSMMAVRIAENCQ